MRESKEDLQEFAAEIFEPMLLNFSKKICKEKSSDGKIKWMDVAKKGIGYAEKGLNYLTKDRSKKEGGGIDWLGLAEKGVGLAAALI